MRQSRDQFPNNGSPRERKQKRKFPRIERYEQADWNDMKQLTQTQHHGTWQGNPTTWRIKIFPEDKRANKTSFTQRTKSQNGMLISAGVPLDHTWWRGAFKILGEELFPAWNCILKWSRIGKKGIFRESRSQKIYWLPSPFRKLLEMVLY